MAFSFAKPVLLTTGSNNLSPYVEQATRTGLLLVARVLPREDSISACLRAGLPRERIITGKGPFTVEANREHIRRFNIGVLVTKDSGAAGGVPEKLRAARLESCQVVVVQRRVEGDTPEAAAALPNVCTTIDELIARVTESMGRSPD